MIPLSQEALALQLETYKLLAISQSQNNIDVVKFETAPYPVLNDILNQENVEDIENIKIGEKIINTVPLKLTRAKTNIDFDVVMLSRDVADEESTIAQTQSGQLDVREESEDESYDNDVKGDN